MAEADPPPHPLAQVEPGQRHELLMAERGLLVAAKADRENELVRTIIQVSSAALFLVPAIITTKDVSIPRLSDAVLLYSGLTLIGASILLSVAEQHLSSNAYARQIDIVFDYYTLKNDYDCHEGSLRWVRWSRISALGSFSLGIILAAIGTATLI